MPLYYPQPLGHYGGFAAPMGPPIFSEGAESEWEIDSTRPVHDISDDDSDRAPSCVGVAVQEKEKIQGSDKSSDFDFSALKKGKLADRLKSQHLKASEDLGGDP